MMGINMDEDFLLVQKMRMGDEKSFERFVAKYYPVILKYCWMHIGDYGYAEDMTQETFMRFFQTLGQYRHYGKVPAEEMMVQFFLPYIVTCCICFRVLSGNKSGSEAFALFLCLIWCAVWTEIILNENIYETVSMPIWFVMTVIAVFYLIYCVYKGQSSCLKMWEGNTIWN